jgi:hypothetical protein
MLKNRLRMARVVAHAGDTYRRIPPEIMIVDFGDRHLKIQASPIDEAAQDVALVPERFTAL